MNPMQLKIACEVALFTRSGSVNNIMSGTLLSYGRHDVYGSSTSLILYGGGLSKNELEGMITEGMIIRHQHAGIDKDALLLHEDGWDEIIDHTFQQLLDGTDYSRHCGKLLSDIYAAQCAGQQANVFRYDEGNGITQLERFGLIACKFDKQIHGENMQLSPAGNLLAPLVSAALATV
jgi:hypothetical protein